jgi:hypothetical protein
MPFLVMQGSNDPAVPPVLSQRTVDSWLLANDILDDGVDNDSIPLAPTSIRHGQVEGGHSFDVSSYTSASGRLIGEYWFIYGMRHAYPGGKPGLTPGLAVDPASERKVSASGVDAQAPSGTAEAYRFFMDHPMPRSYHAGRR